MTQAIEKAVTTLIVLEDPLPIYPSDDGVVDSTRIFDPCFPGHKNTLSPPTPCQLIILWDVHLTPPQLIVVLPSTTTQFREKRTIIKKITPEDLGNAEDKMTMGNFSQNLPAHPFAKLDHSLFSLTFRAFRVFFSSLPQIITLV